MPIIYVLNMNLNSSIDAQGSHGEVEHAAIS